MPDREQPPVIDWANDFDHTDPAWVRNPYPIWDELRDRCPVAHTNRYGGAWLPVRYSDISMIAHDVEHFTSRSVVVSNVRPGPDDLPAPIGLAPPITSDPPFHATARRMLMSAFSQTSVAAHEPMTRQLCRDLLDGVADQDAFDAAQTYAQYIPLNVIIGMLGFPLQDAEIFRRFIHLVLEDVASPYEQRQATIEEREIQRYLDEQIADHRARPRADLTSHLLAAELDGTPLADQHIRGTMILLMVAGIDTTWSAIGSALWHLGRHPDDRRRLLAEPDLMPFAVEELLRAYAPVTMARMVARDVTIAGQRMREGDWVLLAFPAANRDPAVFPQPDRVDLDRRPSRHATFGLGIHRCLGSHLARMELRVALEEWLARHPDFEVAQPDAVTWSTGQVRGPRTLPVRILRRSSDNAA